MNSLEPELDECKEYIKELEQRVAFLGSNMLFPSPHTPDEMNHWLTIDAQQQYIAKLEKQIRYIRDQRGDDCCYLDWEALFKMLPEGYETPERDETVELELCKQYIKSRHNPAVKYVSPQRRIEELEQEIDNLRLSILQIWRTHHCVESFSDARRIIEYVDTDPSNATDWDWTRYDMAKALKLATANWDREQISAAINSLR